MDGDGGELVYPSIPQVMNDIDPMIGSHRVQVVTHQHRREIALADEMGDQRDHGLPPRTVGVRSDGSGTASWPCAGASRWWAAT